VDLFHLPSLMIVAALGAVAVCGLMVVHWLRDRHHVSLIWWAAGMGIGGAGALLQALREGLPKMASVGYGNALLITAVGLLWTGYRVFERRRPLPQVVVAVPLVWLFLCEVPAFYDHLAPRVVVVSLASAVYTLLAAREVRRGARLEPLPSRSLLVFVLYVHAVVSAVRVPLTWLWPSVETGTALHATWLGVCVAATVVDIFLAAVATISMVRDRDERGMRHVAETDALTGVPNRRAFVAATSRHLADGVPGVLLLIDIDHFKVINDTHGHLAGDQVLAAFAGRLRRHLAGDQVFGRIGGEEFAVFAPGATVDDGFTLADALRRLVAAGRYPTDGTDLGITISIGIAATADSDGSFDQLFLLADAALYSAKHAGRDRVRCHVRTDDATLPPLGLVDAGI
jgi:diguanylate cyclase (GGDEF)-like protein